MAWLAPCIGKMSVKDKDPVLNALKHINSNKLIDRADGNLILSFDVLNECGLTEKQSMLLCNVLNALDFKLVNHLNHGYEFLLHSKNPKKLSSSIHTLINYDYSEWYKERKNDKKRKLNKVGDDVSSQPPLKKQRLSPIKSMFDDQKYHKQFLSIFECVQKSALCKELSVSRDVIKEISEYGTGKILKCICANKRCKKRFIALDCDKKEHGSYGKCEGLKMYKFGEYFCSKECIKCTMCLAKCDEPISVCDACKEPLCEECSSKCECCSKAYCETCVCALSCADCRSDGYIVILHSETEGEKCDLCGQQYCGNHDDSCGRPSTQTFSCHKCGVSNRYCVGKCKSKKIK